MARNYAVPPGAFIREWLEVSEKSQRELGEALGYVRKTVNELVLGKAPITPETASRLEKVIGIPAETWLKYEAKYQLDLQRLREVAEMKEHIDLVPPSLGTYLREMDVTSATKSQPGELVNDFLRFVQCATPEAFQNKAQEMFQGDYQLAALRESKQDLDPSLLMAWLRAGELTADYQSAFGLTYSAEKLREILPDLKKRCMNPDDKLVDDVRDILREVGVVFLAIEPPAKLPLYGMTRWIKKKVPVIQQTNRRKNDGFFTWTLFHEIGHVLNDPRGEIHFDFKSDKARTTLSEKEANKFADRQLFGESGIKPFKGITEDGEISGKARELGISPGLAVMMLHRKRQLDRNKGHGLFFKF